MGTTLKDALRKAKVPMTQEEMDRDKEQLINKHRSKNVIQRPNKKVELHSVLPYDFEPVKEQRDPTDDLVILPRIVDERSKELFSIPCEEQTYLVWCGWSEDLWWAPTLKCLNQNFVYRDDLDIYEVKGTEEAYTKARDVTSSLRPGVIPTKSCYILDDPANETYEVYSDPTFSKVKYGKTTPDGMLVHKYKNRFHRDLAILELDHLYSEQSSRHAGKLVVRGYADDEAIVISDGCWLKNSCAMSFVYLDNGNVVQFTRGFTPSDQEQGVLIAEIVGAREAIQYAASQGKKRITYYYDNVSILNVFRNKSTEYLREVTEYKQMLEELNSQDVEVLFVDIHPKTDNNRQDENRALMLFHNMCDSNCRRMSDLYKKDYRAIASNGGKNEDSMSTASRRNPNRPRQYQKYKGYQKGGNKRA